MESEPSRLKDPDCTIFLMGSLSLGSLGECSAGLNLLDIPSTNCLTFGPLLVLLKDSCLDKRPAEEKLEG